jgi:hypothetical protein
VRKARAKIFSMSTITEPLVLDFVEWVAQTPRSYREALDAWRTNCPRLTVWEEAADRGLVIRERIDGQGTLLRVTTAGLAYLRQNSRLPEHVAAAA